MRVIAHGLELVVDQSRGRTHSMCPSMTWDSQAMSLVCMMSDRPTALPLASFPRRAANLDIALTIVLSGALDAMMTG